MYKKKLNKKSLCEKLTLVKIFKRLNEVERIALIKILDVPGINFICETISNCVYHPPQNLSNRKIKKLKKLLSPMRKDIEKLTNFNTSVERRRSLLIKKQKDEQKGGFIGTIFSLALPLLIELGKKLITGK